MRDGFFQFGALGCTVTGSQHPIVLRYHIPNPVRILQLPGIHGCFVRMFVKYTRYEFMLPVEKLRREA